MAKKKTEGGAEFSSSAYLVVPDPEKPSTWKLRVEETPGKVTAAQLGRAAAALGKGFRGNKVQLSSGDRAKAMSKLRSLYRSLKVGTDEMPAVLQQALFTTAIAQLRRNATPLLEAMMGDTEALQALRAETAEALEGLQESIFLDGLSAMLNGTLSMETVTAAVQAALMAMHNDERMADGQPMQDYGCPYKVAATFPDEVIYCDSDGKLYRQSYHMDGTEAVLEGTPEETVFTPTAPQVNQEGAGTVLIEAGPSGSIKLGNIDRAMGVIRGTTLIGPTSVNGGKGRKYSEPALKKIAAMAEGLPGYLNHVAPDVAFRPRDVRELAVRHKNVRYDAATQTVKSDMYVLPQHADLVFGLAETFGDHIGNSLVSRGAVRMEADGTEVVEDVLQLRSADLVSDPASTKGLFESDHSLGAQAAARGADAPVTIADLIEAVQHQLTPRKDTVMDFAAILTHLKANPDQQKLLLESLQVVPKADVTALETKHAAEVKGLQESITAAGKEKDELTKKVAEQDKALLEAKSKLETFEAKDALAAKRVRLQEAIEKSKLFADFGKVAGAISDSFKTLLEGMDEAEWAKQLDDRHTALKGVPQTNGQAPRSHGKDPETLSEGREDKGIPQGAHSRMRSALVG